MKRHAIAQHSTRPTGQWS